jgi:hypothetical protein
MTSMEEKEMEVADEVVKCECNPVNFELADQVPALAEPQFRSKYSHGHIHNLVTWT